MKTIQLRIEIYEGTQTEWVYPVGEHSLALFLFVTAGLIGIPLDRWTKEIEPVLKALEWWWSLAPLSSQNKQ